MDCPFYTRYSQIHGRGLFSNQYFPAGTILFKACDKNCRVFGFAKWINHSWKPNVMLHEEPDGWYLMAIMPIYQGREILANYDWTPDCMKKADPNWI